MVSFWSTDLFFAEYIKCFDAVRGHQAGISDSPVKILKQQSLGGSLGHSWRSKLS